MNKIYAICVYTSLLMLSSIQVMGSNLNFIEPLTPTNVDTHLLQQQLASSQITNAQKQLLVELRTMVEEHSSEAAQLFFDHGDDLEITIVKVLPWAVVRDYIKIVKYICEKCVQDVQAMALLNMHEVFAMAAHYGNISSMQYFLERYGQNEFGLEALGIYEVLTKAVNDDFDAVAFILAQPIVMEYIFKQYEQNRDAEKMVKLQNLLMQLELKGRNKAEMVNLILKNCDKYEDLAEMARIYRAFAQTSAQCETNVTLYILKKYVNYADAVEVLNVSAIFAIAIFRNNVKIVICILKHHNSATNSQYLNTIQELHKNTPLYLYKDLLKDAQPRYELYAPKEDVQDKNIYILNKRANGLQESNAGIARIKTLQQKLTMSMTKLLLGITETASNE